MKGVLFSVFLLLIWTAAAKAVTLNVDFSGQLRGASGVDVAGVLYDVEFEEGSCNELFGGCDTDADFPFATPEAARQASLALLDQVFLDGPSGEFDTSPELTFGCSLTSFCFVLTPFEIAPGGPGIVFVDLVRNRDSSSPSIIDGATRTEWLSPLSTAGDDRVVYATWEMSVIPVPGGGFLLVTGLCCLAAYRRCINITLRV